MKRKWWHEKVAYQIYPKSFKDANGDGIGDLRGIIEKLDYLHDLGVEIVWISPVYKSPFVDQGYDVEDYYAIDPLFGTMDDMDELLAKAEKLNINIVMDLVVNHCSDKHEWFKAACKDPEGPYGKFFYLVKGRPDGTPPTNWRSYFGGSTWELLPGHEDENLYYLHAFAKQQPDLNWENREVREEIYKNIRWWLEKGVRGFRLDAIINIKKALPFVDYPADDIDGRAHIINMLKYANGIHDFLQEMKEEAFDLYEAFTIGELFNYKPEDLPDYIGDDGCFESIFDFSTAILGGMGKGWFDREQVTAEMYKQAVFESKQAASGYGMMANLIENHDEPRGVSHFIPEGDVNETSKKMLGGIMMMNYGLPFLYQGQEIGMENRMFKDVEEFDDIETKDQYQLALDHGMDEKTALHMVSLMSRDNARTPMQWDASENAGFTEGRPWLWVNENYTWLNVKEQMGRKDSVYEFYKGMIRLRKEPEYKETVVYGTLVPVLEDVKNLMAFKRVSADKTLIVIANYHAETQKITLPYEVSKVLVDNTQDFPENFDGIKVSGMTMTEGKTEITLAGYQFLLAEI